MCEKDTLVRTLQATDVVVFMYVCMYICIYIYTHIISVCRYVQERHFGEDFARHLQSFLCVLVFAYEFVYMYKVFVCMYTCVRLLLESCRELLHSY